MTLQPDTLLHDRYTILNELGHGGMGAVYRGRDDNLGVEVAVKENLFVSPEAERQFRREATLLASLRHPNLPRVTDHFVIPAQGQYLVMDFIPGEDAKQLMDRQQGPLPEAQVVKWAREILDALHYLHTRPQPIVHRDIKPGNIKITPEGRAVLVDFGLAKVHDLSQATTTGAKALTPGFAPPEQYGLGRTDPRTDIYSLGATLYTLLTNCIPADSIERAMGQKKLVPIRTVNPAVSEPVAEAIERSMSVKPEDRFDTALEFATALAASPTIHIAPLSSTVQQAALRETLAAGGEGRPGRTPTSPRPTSSAAGGTQPRTGTQPRGSTQPPPAAPAAGRSGLGVLVWLVPVLLLLVVLVVGGGVGGIWLAKSGMLGAGGVASPTAAPAAATPISAAVTEPPAATEAPTLPPASPTPIPATNTAAPTVVVSSPTPEPPSPTPTTAFTPTPAATPRGGGAHGQIAFASDRNGGVPQIFLTNITGKTEAERQVTQLTVIPDGACEPVWSPDGQRLLFVTPCDKKRDQYANSAIYIMNADGTNVQPFISDVGGVYEPDWSKSGIAFTFLESVGKPRINLFSEGSGSARNISAAQSADSHPSWSPDGKMIAFVNTSSTGSPVVYWMYKDGSFAEGHTLPLPITRDTKATAPAWSPDGKWVAYVSNFQIFLVLWDKVGYGAQQRTDAGPNDSPAWSPDGRHLAFESWRDNANHDIYIMNAATGGELVRLTDNPSADFQPAWRP